MIKLTEKFKMKNDDGTKNPKRKLITIGIFAAIVILLISLVAANANKGKDKGFTIPETDRVMRGDIEETITGSAVVEPFERYEIIALVSGDIISSPFEVGDAVNEGDLLYEFDKSTASLGIQRQELNVEQSKNSYNNALKDAEKLTVRAPISGVVSGVEIKVGKDVQMNTALAAIENTKSLEVDLPFNHSQASLIKSGDAAIVSSSAYMSQVSGVVTHVAANPTAQTDGSMLYNVTIKLTNPGALAAGLTVGGEVNGMISPGSGILKSADSEQVNAEVAGEVTGVYVKNGDYVNKGDILFTLSSDSVSNSVTNSNLQYKNSALSLQESYDSLDDYSLTSPITGTVITKNAKAGDTIDRNSSTQTLMVVADVSKLKFVLSIDELDISKVEAGQTVKVTCDALEGEEYIGKITNVSVEGTSTNGVTVYEAEVVVEEPGNLRPSMNIDATVVFNSSANTLMVPSGDIKTVMGKSYVYIKDEDGKADKKDDEPNGAGKDAAPEAPEGYKAVEVETGLSNDEYTEILNGLTEGDEIYRISSGSGSGGDFIMMGGMGAMGGVSVPHGTMGGGHSGVGGAPGGMGGGR